MLVRPRLEVGRPSSCAYLSQVAWPDQRPQRAAPTGVEGLDAILKGGFPRGEVHQVAGGPGTGKTTLGLHYLMAGRDAGERGLYVTLSQTKNSLEAVARSHGWSLDGIVVHELSPGGVIWIRTWRAAGSDRPARPGRPQRR